MCEKTRQWEKVSLPLIFFIFGINSSCWKIDYNRDKQRNHSVNSDLNTVTEPSTGKEKVTFMNNNETNPRNSTDIYTNT